MEHHLGGPRRHGGTGKLIFVIIALGMVVGLVAVLAGGRGQVDVQEVRKPVPLSIERR
jgi:hypothetical protein